MYFSAQMFASKSVIKGSNLEGWLKRFKFKRYISFGYIYLQIYREKSQYVVSYQENGQMSFGSSNSCAEKPYDILFSKQTRKSVVQCELQC